MTENTRCLRDRSAYRTYDVGIALRREGGVEGGGAWTTFRGKRLKVLRAHLSADGLPPGALDGLRAGAGDGALELVEVQPEGKAPMAAPDWRNGARPRIEERLGE